MTGWPAVRLVARREVTQRIRERSFLVSTGISVVIVAIVVLLPKVTGLGGTSTFDLRPGDATGAQTVRAAAGLAPAFDVKVRVVRGGDADAVVRGGDVRFAKAPDPKLVRLLQVANQQRGAAQRPPLRVTSAKPADPERDRKSGLAFFAVILLYGQLLTYGFWVASGVVEEKSSRVVEILLSAIRPRDLLAGKVLGLGLLGLGQLLLVAVLGLGVADLVGAVHVDGTVLAATGLALLWFVLGYAFYACAFAVAGALVPRLEELQASATPLTMTILVSMFLAFAVDQSPDGTLAHVTAFLPTTAPMTMPPRIILGAVAPLEVAGAVLVTLAAAALLIPVAARIYESAVLRTGSAVKLGEAWRAARAARAGSAREAAEV